MWCRRTVDRRSSESCQSAGTCYGVPLVSLTCLERVSKPEQYCTILEKAHLHCVRLQANFIGTGQLFVWASCIWTDVRHLPDLA